MPTKGLFNQVFAKFSPDHKYRYSIIDRWGNGPSLTFLMLNPSKADGIRTDPTYLGCQKRARVARFDALAVINAYALVSTDPRVLDFEPDPIGPENDAVIRQVIAGSDVVICAWGAHIRPDRLIELRKLIPAEKKTFCLGINKDGSPKHPLYVSMDQEWLPYII